MVKLAMVAPPPLLTQPGGEQSRAEENGDAVQRRPEGFMQTLFPGFSTDTFIWRISVLQVVEYVGSVLLGNSYGVPKLCSLYLLGASWGPSIAQGAVWRMFLPMMLHANPLHIFFNIFFQLRIGCNMEKQFGRRKFCLMYLFCGFVGNLLSVVADPMKLAVGASTSGFGLLGVWAAEVMLTWELLGASRPRVFLWFAFMLGSCVMMSTISPNVDFVGHFGGALAGFLLAIILADMDEEQLQAANRSAESARDAQRDAEAAERRASSSRAAAEESLAESVRELDALKASADLRSAAAAEAQVPALAEERVRNTEDEAKKRKAVEKKLRQICELEQRAARGEELNEDQVLKISGKSALEEELQKLHL